MAADFVRRTRGWLVYACVSLAALTWAGACIDGASPVDIGPATGPGIVSDPVSNNAPAASGSASSLAASSATDVVYVSLPPGAIPDGEFAIVSSPQTGRVVSIFAGGFDPVPVAATVGDTIEIVVRDIAGAVVLQAQTVVVASRRPRVVRTDPPPRKRDLPLNATIVIVFSEPIAPTSLTEAAIKLLNGTTPVVGRLELRDPEQLTAAFVPATPLDPSTTYQLVVTQGIRDLDGESLEEPVSAEFTTVAQAPPAAAVASVALMPSTVRATQLADVYLRATVRDAGGNEIPDVPVLWSSTTGLVRLLSDDLGHTVRVYGTVGTHDLTASSGGHNATAAVEIVDDRTLVVVSAGGQWNAVCGLTTGGEAYCQGSNSEGQLGYGLATTDQIRAPVAVTGGLSFVSITSGWAHSCGLTADGGAYCWGSNHQGQLGTDSIVVLSPEPVEVSGGLAFAQIAAGGSHTCGLSVAGTAYCWGWNLRGQLGDGSTVNRRTPAPVATGGLEFTQISAGSQHTCGLTATGAAYCWGANFLGQLGDSSFTDRHVPVPVSGGLSFGTLSTSNHSIQTCGLTNSGATYCWGDGHSIGIDAAVPSPVATAVGLAFERISVAWGHSCGLTTAGTVWCWGSFWGNGGDASSIVPPTIIAGGLGFRSIVSGGASTCGVAVDGFAYCYWLDADGRVYRIPGQQGAPPW